MSEPTDHTEPVKTDDEKRQSIERALLNVLYFITGRDATIKSRVRGRFVAIVIVPARQMSHVIGQGGKVVKAVKAVAAMMATRQGLELGDLHVKDPPAATGPDYAEDATYEMPLTDIEDKLEAILEAADFEAQVVGIEDDNETTISIGRNQYEYRLYGELKEVAEACANGLTRNANTGRTYRLTTPK